MSDKERLRRVLKGFFDSRGMKPTADGIRMWVMALADLPLDKIEFAFIDFMRRSTVFPTPAAIRQHAIDAGSLSDADRAVMAWDSVRQQVSSVGSYYSVDFEDKVINAVVRQMGGWVKLCNTSPSEMKWVGREFCKRHEIISRTGLGDPSPLPGIISSNGDAADTIRIASNLPERDLRITSDDNQAAGAIVHQTALMMDLGDE